MNDLSSPQDKFDIQDAVLDTASRTSEILFGLIMVLSFTCSLSVASAGRADVREMLIGALGCNLAWGIIDAFFYLMNICATRGRERVLIKRLRNSAGPDSDRTIFQSVIPEFLIGSLSKNSLQEVREHLLKQSEKPQGTLIGFSDLRAAFLVFVLVFLATFPVAIPFIVMSEPNSALRISNLIANLMLFGLGYTLGRYAGRKAWLWGLGMMVIGSALVSMTIALGG